LYYFCKKMAKNTYSSAFRRLDVDRLNETTFDDSDLNSDSPDKFDFNEIVQLLLQNQPAEALVACLENPPQTLRSQTEKVILIR